MEHTKHEAALLELAQRASDAAARLRQVSVFGGVSAGTPGARPAKPH